jgi:hypothetical protein
VSSITTVQNKHTETYTLYKIFKSSYFDRLGEYIQNFTPLYYNILYVHTYFLIEQQKTNLKFRDFAVSFVTRSRSVEVYSSTAEKEGYVSKKECEELLAQPNVGKIV